MTTPGRRGARRPASRVAAVPAAVRELIGFGAVGGIAYGVDVGLFNVLRFAGPGLLEDRPLTAKVVSASVATLVAWLGNRYWTFRRRRRVAAHRELVLFVVMNIAGLGIALACLGISHYVLGLTSALADNVSANGVGLVLGTAFRFLAYRHLVFTGDPPPPGRRGAVSRR